MKCEGERARRFQGAVNVAGKRDRITTQDRLFLCLVPVPCSCAKPKRINAEQQAQTQKLNHGDFRITL